MENKYIENLGICDHIDEGLWDRIKARTSSYAQAGKNLALGGTTDINVSKFNSIFQKFLTKSMSIVQDFWKVILPYWKEGKFSTSERGQIINILALFSIMSELKNQPLTEANLFTRPFSVLGAQASGNVQNIINSYKKQLTDSYDSFKSDASKLKIDPETYLKKIGGKNPLANVFLDRYKFALNLTTGAASTASSPSAPPVIPSGGTSTTAPPVLPPDRIPPVLPSGRSTSSVPPVLPSGVPPVIPSGGTSPTASSSSAPPVLSSPSASSSSPTPTATESSLKLAHNEPEKLIGLAINKILTLLSPDGKMLDDIHSYIRRDASKAEVPFPANPVIEIKSSDGGLIKLHMRYKAVKSISGHAIQIHLEKKTKDASGKIISQRAPRWEEFIKFAPSDVITLEGKINPNFNLLRNIFRNNPEVANVMPSFLVTPTINQKMAEALAGIVEASVPDSERGVRRIGDTPPPGTEKGSDIHATTPAPPEAKTPVERPSSPDKTGRETKKGVEKPLEIDPKTGKPIMPPELKGGIPTIVKREMDKEKEKKENPSTSSKKKKSPVAPVAEGFKYREFFPL